MIKKRTSRQDGSVLLESLIAILIFSMGILALVALLGASVKNTTSAKYRTEASLLVNQVIGQMWVGDKTALATDYGSATSGAKYTAWKDQVAEALPGIVDAIEEPAVDGVNLPVIEVDGNQVTVRVFWQAPGDVDPHNYFAVTQIHD